MATAKKKPKPKAGTSKEAAALRRRLFAQAYIANGGNASEAAKAAGYSPKTAGVQGHRLLKDVQVQRLIAASAEDLAKKYELTADRVVRSIVQEINFDPANLFDQHGRMKTVSEMDEDTRAALVGVEVTEEVVTRGRSKTPIGTLRTAKVKWVPKQSAREQAMKHLGMFKADNVQRNPLEGLPHEVLVALRDGLKKQLGLA
jgi:phage terminase small subunit